jgi:hypothetical protein
MSSRFVHRARDGPPTGGASERPHRDPLRIGITLGATGSEVVLDAAAMIAEADAIWRQHGLTVVDVSCEIARVDAHLTSGAAPHPKRAPHCR